MNKIIITVDTNILRSSSESGKKGAETSRRFLLIMMEKRYYVALTDEMDDEWNRHQSKYAAIWSSSMKRKGLLVMIAISDKSRSVVDELNEYCSRCEEFEYLRKDIHLVYSALETQLRIASYDEKARKGFAKISKEDNIEDIALIVWVNPEKDESVFDWMDRGMPIEENRRLGEYKP